MCDDSNDEVIILYFPIPDLKVGPADWIYLVLDAEWRGNGDAVPDIASFLEDSSLMREVALEHGVCLVVVKRQRVFEGLWWRKKGRKIGGTAATHSKVG